METDWDVNDSDPDNMLDVVRQLKPGRSKLGRRKLRLFACACCRNWWEQLNSNSREAPEITELYTYDHAPRSEFGRAQRISTWNFEGGAESLTAKEALKRLTINGATNWLTSGAEIAGFCIGQHLRGVARLKSAKQHNQETIRQINLIHEVFGEPNAPPVIDPAWLEWNDGAVPQLADEIYVSPQNGDYVRLRQLLQLAGCNDATILDHCTSRYPHVMGCWLVDAIRGVHWPKPRPQYAD